MEQDLKMRRLNDLLPEAGKDDIITVFLALQKQNFVLSNTVSNLVKKWPIHPPLHTRSHRSLGFIRDQQLKLSSRQCY